MTDRTRELVPDSSCVFASTCSLKLLKDKWLDLWQPLRFDVLTYWMRTAEVESLNLTQYFIKYNCLGWVPHSKCVLSGSYKAFHTTQSAHCSSTQSAHCSSTQSAHCSSTQSAHCSSTQSAHCSSTQSAHCSSTTADAMNADQKRFTQTSKLAVTHHSALHGSTHTKCWLKIMTKYAWYGCNFCWYEWPNMMQLSKSFFCHSCIGV